MGVVRGSIPRTPQFTNNQTVKPMTDSKKRSACKAQARYIRDAAEAILQRIEMNQWDNETAGLFLNIVSAANNGFNRAYELHYTPEKKEAADA